MRISDFGRYCNIYVALELSCIPVFKLLRAVRSEHAAANQEQVIGEKAKDR